MGTKTGIRYEYQVERKPWVGGPTSAVYLNMRAELGWRLVACRNLENEGRGLSNGFTAREVEYIWEREAQPA